MYEHSVGDILKLRVTPWHRSPALKEACSASTGSHEGTEGSDLAEFEVLHAFTPFTMSAVYRVRPVGARAGEVLAALSSLPGCPSEPTEFVVKFYDRRHMNNERIEDDHPYSAAVEAEYQSYLAAKQAKTSEARTCDDIVDPPECDSVETESANTDSTTEYIPIPKYEAELEENAASDFAEETLVYRRLAEGFARAEHPATPYYFGEVECDSEIGVIRGILIQSLWPATRLTKYLERIGACGYRLDEVARVADAVVKAAETVMEYEFTSYDIRAANVILTGLDLPAETPFDFTSEIRPIFIDFADCRLRYLDEIDLEWLTTQENYGIDKETAVQINLELRRITETPCADHGESCWSQPMAGGKRKGRGQERHREPAWIFKRNPRFVVQLTEEQKEIKKHLPYWGWYSDGPHPMTLAEYHSFRAAKSLKVPTAPTLSSATSAGISAKEESPLMSTLDQAPSELNETVGLSIKDCEVTDTLSA